MDKTINWVYADLVDVTADDIQRRYRCDIEDAQEAMEYIKKFIKAVDKEFGSVE